MQELPRLLAAEALKAPPRPELAAEERRALAAELASTATAHERLAAELDREIAEADQRRQKAEADAARARETREAASRTYSTARDLATVRLWAGRPALADELLARIKAEVEAGADGRESVSLQGRLGYNYFDPPPDREAGHTRREGKRARRASHPGVREQRERHQEASEVARRPRCWPPARRTRADATESRPGPCSRVLGERKLPQAMRGRRLPRPPQERTLIPDPGRDARRAAERQFWGFIELEDEPGYWAWVSLQPGFDPESLLARRRAAEAWREGLAEWRARRRRL